MIENPGKFSPNFAISAFFVVKSKIRYWRGFAGPPSLSDTILDGPNNLIQTPPMMNRLVSALALALLAISPHRAAALTVPVQEDTSTTASGLLTSAQGSASLLSVNKNQVAFLSFGLSNPSVVPAAFQSASIRNATLLIYISSLDQPGDLALHACGPFLEKFPEKTLPPPQTDGAAFYILPAATLRTRSFISVDVTQQVISALASAQDLNLAIETASARLMLGSKEGVASGYAAQLVIDADFAPSSSTSSPPFQIGAVTTGPTPAVSLTGPGATLNFTLPVGPPGIQGPAGNQGPAGPAGSSGPIGPSGAPGLAGPAGPSGPSGPAGPVGPSGPRGIDGPQGPGGLTGPGGPRGLTGPAGPQGLPGITTLINTGTATALAPNVQPDAWKVNGIIYISATGSDATGLRNDTAHPFLSGTAAYAVAQPYDVIQAGPGIWGAPGYPPWLPATITIPLSVRGAGMPQFSPDFTQLVGGTRIFGAWGANTNTQINGFEVRDLGIDSGAALTGPNSPGGGLGLNDVQNFLISNIALLGAGVSSPTGQELLVMSGGPNGGNGVVRNIRVALAGQAVVVKTDNVSIDNLWSYDNWGETLVFKDGGGAEGLNTARHCSLTNSVFTGSNSYPSDIWIDETSTTSSYQTVCDIKMSNITTAKGIAISNANTSLPMNFGSITNWFNDATLSGAAAYPGSLSLTTPWATLGLVYGSISNSESYASKYVCFSPIQFSNVHADNCSIGFELGVSATDTYASFSNCSANNCSYGIVEDSPCAYLLNNPISVTGTSIAPWIGNNPSAAIAWPGNLCYASSFENNLTNTTAETTVVPGQYNEKGTNVLPLVIQNSPINLHIRGRYAATGTDSVVFRVYLGGTLIAQSNPITPAAGAGQSYKYDANFLSRQSGGFDTFDFVQFNSVAGGDSGGFYPYTPAGDAPLTVTAQWSAASPADTLTFDTLNLSIQSRETPSW